MANSLIIDTETTGFSDPVEPIEIAWIQLSAEPMGENLDSALNVTKEFEQRYKSSQAISFSAMATHHITEADLADCPPPSDFSLPPDTAFLVGHNIDYDWSVIGKPDIPRICTLALSRRLWCRMQIKLVTFIRPKPVESPHGNFQK